MGNEVEKTVKNAGDAIKESVHRSSAELERDKRSEMGDTMTGGEKNEGKAEVDRLKRDARNL